MMMIGSLRGDVGKIRRGGSVSEVFELGLLLATIKRRTERDPSSLARCFSSYQLHPYPELRARPRMRMRIQMRAELF